MTNSNGAFDRAFIRTGLAEGGYSNQPNDRGGPTKYGITEAVARANGYAGDMMHLTIQDARRIAKSQYWDLMMLDDVASVDWSIAAELFDTGYNMGIAVVGRFFQTALNALNQQQRFYHDVKVDGLVGPMTVAAVRKYAAIRGRDGVTVMLRALNSFQCVRYISIAGADPKQESFVFGWILQRVEIT